jgi:hypothetical protein
VSAPGSARRVVARLARRPPVRELLILLAFCLFTAVLTWPYVARLRDAVVDPGDPYLVAWILWWDYHQTFRDPLQLFHSNVFYPFRYTLAFSEHCYGIALPLFPLFALGLKPLTVHAVAMFFGFALCGYAAFRLARTLTGSAGVGWVAGIAFAFVPYRFQLMSHLPYLFSPWVPLLFEALILFARARTRRRAAWLGVAFLMSGLTSVSVFTLSLVPFALAAAILLTRYRLWREREFWVRGAVALGLASLALLPFMLPYLIASRLYGFKRSIEEVKANSAWPIHWLSVENRNKLWFGMGESVFEGFRFKLFPGLLTILFSLAAMLVGARPAEERAVLADKPTPGRNWIARLDALIFFAVALSILAVGFDGTNYFGGIFGYITSERALALLTVAVTARLCLAYPRFLRAAQANLVETLRSERRSAAFWLGLMLTAVGFCYSLGWNFFFYRICYDLLPMFRSMRVPTRGAMIAYLGLALLAGLGVKRLAELIAEREARVRPAAVFAVACALLLFELNAAPLKFMRGDVYPDAVTLRLKETKMRGGIVVLPAGADFNHRHILRAADHAKPLIVGTSGFNSPYEDQIEGWTRAGTIPLGFMNLLEQIPASYLVVENGLVAPERKTDYETFLVRSVAAGRLRFVNRFDARSDLYAVVKTEPDAKSEAALPFGLSIKEWAAQIEDDPVNLVESAQHITSSQSLFRMHVAAFGSMPRYADFLGDARALGRGVLQGFDEQDRKLESNMRSLADELTKRPAFKELYDPLNDAQYVERLLANAGVDIGAADREALVSALASREESRAGVLLKVVADPRFVAKEQNRSLVVLHYFGYFRRNPGDAPDRGLEGLEFWIRDLETNHAPNKISAAFKDSIEYGEIKAGRKK